MAIGESGQYKEAKLVQSKQTAWITVSRQGEPMSDLKELCKKLEAEALLRQEARWLPLETQLRSLSQWSYLLAEASLAAAGLHKHGGVWRRPLNHGRTAQP